MFNVSTVVESIKRHWLAILTITILAFAAGAGYSMLRAQSQGEELQNHAYTAESSIYVTATAIDGSLIQQEIDYLISDARCTILSEDVSGELRRKYGEGIAIASPFMKDAETKNRMYSNYVFVDVSAPTQELALQVANEAAELAAAKIKATLPVEDATVASQAYLRTGENLDTQASNRGIDELDKIKSAAESASAVSLKRLIIFGFVGIFGSIFCFACFDILTRRIRSSRDIERLIDVSSLASLRGEGDYARTAAAVSVLMQRNGLKRCIVAGASEADGAKAVADRLAAAGASDCLCGAVSFADSSAVGEVAQADTVLLVFKEAASSSVQIDETLKALRVADVPVLAAVFVPKKAK